MALRDLYHRWIPDPVRFPIGRVRRGLIDRGLRLLGRHGALPPRSMLQRVQSTPWAMEYLDVGRRCADTLRQELAGAGLGPDREATVLDFGCGLGRTLRHFGETGWRLHGCDVDAEMIEWCSGALSRRLPGVDLRVTAPEPPLPYDDETFDALWAISVFTHFPTRLQSAWATELARILAPGGLAIVTTMGPWVFDPLPPGDVASSAIEGFRFVPAGVDFNDSAAIHDEAGVRHFFEPRFEVLAWRRGGLDGFQDLTLLRRR